MPQRGHLKAIRLSRRWERYNRRCKKLNAWPRCPSYMRDIGQEVALTIHGSYRKVRQ